LKKINKPPGIHGAYQHEGGRVGEAGGGARDGDLAVFEGLAQHLQYVFFEFRQFVEEKQTVMCHRNLSRARIAAAPDQPGIGDGMMGVTEGALGDQGLLVVEQTHDRVDLGGFQGFGEAQVGENRRHPACQHGLAAAGRADHQDIMRAGRCDLQSALGLLLAAYFGKVLAVVVCAGEQFRNRDAARFDHAFAVEESRHFAEVVHAIDRYAVSDSAFPGIFAGENYSVYRPVPGGDGHRQGTADRFDPSIEGELSHDDEASGGILLDQPGGGEQADRHGQVEGGTVLFDACGSEVDGDAPRGKFVAGILDGGFDPVLALLDRPFGQPHGGELGQAAGDIDLHFNLVGVDPRQGAGQNFGEHV